MACNHYWIDRDRHSCQCKWCDEWEDTKKIFYTSQDRVAELERELGDCKDSYEVMLQNAIAENQRLREAAKVYMDCAGHSVGCWRHKGRMTANDITSGPDCICGYDVLEQEVGDDTTILPEA